VRNVLPVFAIIRISLRRLMI